jgi:hypothetical protein
MYNPRVKETFPNRGFSILSIGTSMFPIQNIDIPISMRANNEEEWK